MSSFDPNRITYIGETDHRNKLVKFGIKAKDRTRHVYVIGKTGTGKSTLLENMAVQDIQNGEGFAFIDPHGKTADLLLDYIPEHRINDVVYFAPFDLANPVSFNVMEDIGPDKRHLVAAGLMSAFKKIWVDAWSARMEYILNNTILALLEYPGATLLGINRMLVDREFRAAVVASVTDPGVKSFWEDEFARYTDKFAAEATPAIQNKVGQFTANPVIRNIVGQSKSSFNIREIMDQRKILIINLSKGQVGEDSANLLGSMLITKIYLAAMSRADLREDELNKLPNFYLYVDEFQSFANESFADILSEARKYKLNLTMAHQYIEQMSDEVRAAVFGNVGTMITFRVGATDAEYLEKEFAPLFTAEDLVNLGFAQVYLKLMIDGMSSAPFSARTLGPIASPAVSYRDVAIARSREQFARARRPVEEDIITWHEKVFGREEREGGGGRSETRSAPPPRREGSSSGDRGGQRGGGSFRGEQRGGRPPERKEESGIPRSEQRSPVKPPEGREPRQEEGKQKGFSNREDRVRQAVSLSRLKEEERARQKKEKGPSEERLKDLRDALAAVLQQPVAPDEGITPVPREPVQQTPSSRPAPQVQPQQQPQQSQPPKQEVKQTPPPPPVQNPSPKPAQSAPVPPAPNLSQQKQALPEVPEHVLKKLFDREKK
ncbi:MAG: type IV secretion system DNA-binding domain-containing protein [Patescibacteria group bacterium]|mgnify:CR=1 FL=1